MASAFLGLLIVLKQAVIFRNFNSLKCMLKLLRFIIGMCSDMYSKACNQDKCVIKKIGTLKNKIKTQSFSRFTLDNFGVV